MLIFAPATTSTKLAAWSGITQEPRWLKAQICAQMPVSNPDHGIGLQFGLIDDAVAALGREDRLVDLHLDRGQPGKRILRNRFVVGELDPLKVDRNGQIAAFEPPPLP